VERPKNGGFDLPLDEWKAWRFSPEVVAVLDPSASSGVKTLTPTPETRAEMSASIKAAWARKRQAA